MGNYTDTKTMWGIAYVCNLCRVLMGGCQAWFHDERLRYTLSNVLLLPRSGDLASTSAGNVTESIVYSLTGRPFGTNLLNIYHLFYYWRWFVLHCKFMVPYWLHYSTRILSLALSWMRYKVGIAVMYRSPHYFTRNETYAASLNHNRVPYRSREIV